MRKCVQSNTSRIYPPPGKGQSSVNPPVLQLHIFETNYNTKIPLSLRSVELLGNISDSKIIPTVKYFVNFDFQTLQKKRTAWNKVFNITFFLFSFLPPLYVKVKSFVFFCYWHIRVSFFRSHFSSNLSHRLVAYFGWYCNGRHWSWRSPKFSHCCKSFFNGLLCISVSSFTCNVLICNRQMH